MIKQSIIHNNTSNHNDISSLIWNNIHDDSLINNLHNYITDSYQQKLNLIHHLLNSDASIPIKNMKDVKKYFNILNPLNNEFNLGCYQWSFKLFDNKLYIQNSISKSDACVYFYDKYINLIKKNLSNSNITFTYHEYKIPRFNKSIDIIFVIEI